MELENRDALNRYSAATYGFNNSKTLAVAGNARYGELGYDGFEDYDYGGNCVDDHFSFRNVASNLTTTESHSGRRSIKVSSATPLTLRKTAGSLWWLY